MQQRRPLIAGNWKMYKTPDEAAETSQQLVERVDRAEEQSAVGAVVRLRQAPGDATLRMLYDRADFMNGSIHEVKFTLGLAIILVVGVIFLFLRNPRATLISALALPTSLIGTFALMKVFGFSLDNLSLMAITLAVGFVVDDAIVVLENIVRYREKGEMPMQAALTGTREIGFTVVSMTLSLVAVFIPIIFMSGLVGRLFREFALTVTIAILISGVVSLTLTPMLSSRFLSATVACIIFWSAASTACATRTAAL